MAKRPLEIDMCAGSQLRDTQDEMLDVQGADISEMLAGKGRLNDNHGKGFFNCLGKVTVAKKIFKKEDCEDDRQRYYWEKVKSPYIYVKGELFDDEDHPNAKAAAAILRNIHKSDCPLKVKASVEGGVLARGIADKGLLSRTKIHSVALTFVPANQATLVEPLNLDKTVDHQADEMLIKSVMHLVQTSVPSFRQITRDASAAKIEQNIQTILSTLGADTASAELKKTLIQESLELRIADNIKKINSLVKGESKDSGESYDMFHGSPHGSIESFDNARAPVFFTPHPHVAKQYAQGQVIGTGKIQDGQTLNPTIHAVRITGTKSFDFRKPEHRELYTKLQSTYQPPHKLLSLPKVDDEGFIMSHTGLPGYGYVRALMPLLRSNGFDSMWTDEGTQGHSLALFDPKGKVSITDRKLAKALMAGYGGAGAPTNLVGGGVMQSESLDVGPKSLRYITCDDCGKEQVYGKFQVKCRECGKAFPMAKLEKFFRINKG